MHQRQIVDFTPNRPHALPDAKRGAKGLPRTRWLRGLGVLDQVVEWLKPEDRPEWMTAEQYEALPATLAVRELRYEVGRPGFRTRKVTLVTSLLDAEAYPLGVLAELYGARWRVELSCWVRARENGLPQPDRDLDQLRQTQNSCKLKRSRILGNAKPQF